MRTLKYAVCGAAVCGALLVPPAVAQKLDVSETGLHDGIWRVAAEPAAGPCSKVLEFNISVDGGRVSYSGILPVNASGSVTAVGVVAISVIRGAETVAAQGMVRGDTASGEWVSPEKNCSGSWVARKA